MALTQLKNFLNTTCFYAGFPLRSDRHSGQTNTFNVSWLGCVLMLLSAVFPSLTILILNGNICANGLSADLETVLVWMGFTRCDLIVILTACTVNLLFCIFYFHALRLNRGAISAMFRSCERQLQADVARDILDGHGTWLAGVMALVLLAAAVHILLMLGVYFRCLVHVEPSYLSALSIWLFGLGSALGVLGGPAIGVEAVLYFFPRYNTKAFRQKMEKGKETDQVAVVLEEDNMVNTPADMLELMDTTMRALSDVYVVHFVQCTLLCGLLLVYFCGLFLTQVVTPAAAIGRSVCLMYALVYWARLEVVSRGCRRFVEVRNGLAATLRSQRPDLDFCEEEASNRPNDGA